MMDENFSKVTEEYITQRVNWHGQNEPDEVNGAYMKLRSHMERLRETLTEEQRILLRGCENAYHVADGETQRYFYKAGFQDAMQFLLHIGGES